MSCDRWQELASTTRIDQLDTARRTELLIHLRECGACRRIAIDGDPTLIFDLLPPEPVGESEIEDIRSTVHALRRVRSLAPAPFRRTRRVLAVAASAAVVALALFLVPQQPFSQPPREVPFTGAVGIGAGIMDLSAGAVAGESFEMQIERFRLGGSSYSTLLALRPDQHVNLDLGEGHRVRFRVAGASTTGLPDLVGFRWLRDTEQREILLLETDSILLSAGVRTLEPATLEASERDWRLRLVDPNREPGRP